ncbi:MAG: NAD-dependent deacylase [Chloroflexi bacterium]|jgi:NAD-dependent deacetylase|nr:NAD-dependent deacylase [Chloroflexota bacterium]
MGSPSIHIPPALAQALRSARHIAVLTGAGVSAESGVPTFRDAQTGLWAKYDLEELATPQAFQRSPRLVWEWYAWRRELVAAARPNPGHYALVEMENRAPNFTLITQNVDQLHQQAGSRRVIELHGSLWRTKCSREGRVVESWPETGDVPPRCPHCSDLLRPDVVWFGEALPERELMEAFAAAQQCDVFIAAGTSAIVQPAASLPLLAARSGAVLVEVNPQETPLTGEADYFLQGPSGSVLPALVQAAWGV